MQEPGGLAALERPLHLQRRPGNELQVLVAEEEESAVFDRDDVGTRLREVVEPVPQGSVLERIHEDAMHFNRWSRNEARTGVWGNPTVSPAGPRAPTCVV